MLERSRDVLLVSIMCWRLGLSASGFYEWHMEELNARTLNNWRFRVRIRELHAASDGLLGRRRMQKVLR